MGFEGGEAFIEKMVLESWVLQTKLGGEGFGFGRLRAPGTISVERVTDDECFDLMLADEAGDGLEVCAQRGAMNGKQGLRDNTERVGDGQADAAVAHVESEDAGGSHAPSVQSTACGATFRIGDEVRR